MTWARSEAETSRLIVLPEVGSTNDALAAIDADEADFTVVATTSQTAGRGRLGRVWVAPPGKTLAVSVLLRPVLPGGAPLPVERFGWFPLIAGLAMTRAVSSLVPSTGAPRVGLKWPNDVQVDGLKVSGLLAELLPGAGGGGGAVVLGAGLNLSIGADELPVPTATSLVLAGTTEPVADLADLALSRYLVELRQLVDGFLASGADVAASGIHSAIESRCTTIGSDVRVQLPGGADLLGVATGIDDTGRLLVRRGSDGAETAVAAGDVTHLRYE